MHSLKKTFVITGSTSGIGQKLVEIFASQGAAVFAGYRDEKNLPDNPPQNVNYFYIDMCDRNSIVEAANFIKSKTDKIDVLINVAGCVIAGAFENIDTDRLRQQFDVNVFSHIDFTQNLIPLLGGGRVINISSVASFGHFPFISPYCASKRALDIFFNAFAIENHRNIKVISVKPGVIATPLWQKSVDLNEKYMDECPDYEKEFKFLKENAIKNGSRGLKVEQVAELIQKIVNAKNPKSSYTIGLDCKLGHLLSYLPQDVVNKLIRLGLKWRAK